MLIMLYCHLSVAILCLNVAFDLVVVGLPACVLRILRILPEWAFRNFMTSLIDWTTPIVFAMPMVFSGTRIYCDNVNLLIEAKRTDSVLLSNHGSRIDWMVGMFCGYSTQLSGKKCERSRVGFVCEAILQFMPLIGWYRKLICEDIFVRRSYNADAPIIEKNIDNFHSSDTRRMLFLSPEGMVVDFGDRDKAYIDSCRQFCRNQGYSPFEYVLTPRYKGMTHLLKQVEEGGPIVSVCMAFVKNGKLLNCKLTSPERVVPDIYLLNQGIGGKPVDIFMNMERIRVESTSPECIKAILMNDYKRKDQLLADWHRKIESRDAKWFSQFSLLEKTTKCAAYFQLAHAAVILAVAAYFGLTGALLRGFLCLFCIVLSCHSLGWVLNGASMESVPFETGIKAILCCVASMGSKKMD